MYVMMMDEYIDRKALRDALYDADAITMNGVKILNQFPAADVVPIRHGRWFAINPCKDVEGWIEYDYQCSNCKEISWEASNYCQNCGAKMDLEE